MAPARSAGLALGAAATLGERMQAPSPMQPSTGRWCAAAGGGSIWDSGAPALYTVQPVLRFACAAAQAVRQSHIACAQLLTQRADPALHTHSRSRSAGGSLAKAAGFPQNPAGVRRRWCAQLAPPWHVMLEWARTHARARADKGRIPSALGEAAGSRMGEGLDGDRQTMVDSLDSQFARLREDMLLYGFRCGCLLLGRPAAAWLQVLLLPQEPAPVRPKVRLPHKAKGRFAKQGLSLLTLAVMLTVPACSWQMARTRQYTLSIGTGGMARLARHALMPTPLLLCL